MLCEIYVIHYSCILMLKIIFRNYNFYIAHIGLSYIIIMIYQKIITFGYHNLQNVSKMTSLLEKYKNNLIHIRIFINRVKEYFWQGLNFEDSNKFKCVFYHAIQIALQKNAFKNTFVLHTHSTLEQFGLLSICLFFLIQ